MSRVSIMDTLGKSKSACICRAGQVQADFSLWELLASQGEQKTGQAPDCHGSCSEAECLGKFIEYGEDVLAESFLIGAFVGSLVLEAFPCCGGHW